MTIDFLDSNCEANIAENFRRTNAAIEEGGGGGGVLVVNITFDEHEVGTCDKTAAEMWAAYQSGIVMIVRDNSTGDNVHKRGNIVIEASASFPYAGTHQYAFFIYDTNSESYMTFYALGDNEYPVCD